MKLNALLDYLDKMPRLFITLLGFFLVIIIGLLDRATGYEISVSLFYLLPILLIAWFIGGGSVASISIFSSLVWFAADVSSGYEYSHMAIPVWNALMRLGIFLIVGSSFAAMRKLHARESENARIDYVTGVSNARSFYEQVRLEVARSARYGRHFTIAYLDIDNFKSVNDTFGHGAGDELLRTVADTMKGTLRSTDVISRLGGDEFAIFLPETKNPPVFVALNKVQERLLDSMRKNNWPVTFSMGVVTCYDPNRSLDEIIKLADNLMYAAKANGKNNTIYKTIGSPQRGPEV